MPKRKSYTAEFKLEVVKYAEDIGSNRKAAIDKGVNEKSVREWKQQKNILSATNRRKRAR